MEWLTSLYPEVKAVLQEAAPVYWPELQNAFNAWLEAPPSQSTILSLATCRAVGGHPQDAIHVAAALTTAELCLRIFDDLQDRDRPGQLWQQVGAGQAWNYAAAIQVLSFDILSKGGLRPAVFEHVNRLFIDTFLTIAAGQDRDMAGQTKTVDAYWQTIEWKTATAFSAVCAAGAMVGCDNPQLVEACRTFGHHVGLAIQIFNDMESVWRPAGLTDFQRGKVTLPVIYGLQLDHPCREELLILVETNRVAAYAPRVKEILEQIDVKSFLIWAALKERDQALDAISICPDFEGKEALTSFVTGMFGDIDDLHQSLGQS